MNHNKIKFSHHYYKLDGCNFSRARLLAVQEFSLKDLPEDFWDYDTEYRYGKYELKSGKYLVLVFWAGKLFTTIRPAFPSRKIEYYKSKIGEDFEILISNP